MGTAANDELLLLSVTKQPADGQRSVNETVPVTTDPFVAAVGLAEMEEKDNVPANATEVVVSAVNSINDFLVNEFIDLPLFL